MQRTEVRFFRVLLAVSLLVLGPGQLAHAQQAEVEHAQALMSQGKPAEAYGYLLPFEDKFAGNVDYDYALGVAALDSGKPDKATHNAQASPWAGRIGDLFTVSLVNTAP